GRSARPRWHAGIVGAGRVQLSGTKAAGTRPPALRVLSKSPIGAFVTSFRDAQFSFSVLTVQGIFTEMDLRTFPEPGFDDQIRTRPAHRRAQPASLSAGCGEHCECDPRRNCRGAGARRPG